MTTQTPDSTPATQETYAQWDERVNCPRRRAARYRMDREDWEPTYEKWRHGGSYVTNLIYPNGAVGCIASAQHTASAKFEIACHHDAGTFPTRRAAAFVEREIVNELWRSHDEVCAYVQTFSWTGRYEDSETDAPHLRISGPHEAGHWDITIENVPGFESHTDDAAGSAWSTASYVLLTNGATAEEHQKLGERSPKHLTWCFDGIDGPYAYDPNDEE